MSLIRSLCVMGTTYEEEEEIAAQREPSKRQLSLHSKWQRRTVDAPISDPAPETNVDYLLKTHIQDPSGSRDVDNVAKSSCCTVGHRHVRQATKCDYYSKSYDWYSTESSSEDCWGSATQSQRVEDT